MSYNPYESVPTMPQTAAWPTEAPPAQVPGWGTDQPYSPGPPGMGPMGPPQASPSKPSPGLIIVLALLSVAALAAGAFFLVGGDDDDPTTTDDQQVSDQGPDGGPVTTLPGNPDDVELPPAGPAPGSHDGLSVEQAAADAGAPDLPPTGEAQFDDLAEDCYAGSMQACDDLYAQTPVGSDYEAYGDTCGARVADAHGYYCTDLLPDPEPPAD